MKSATEDQLAIITKISNPPLPITTLSSLPSEIDIEAPKSETCSIKIEAVDPPSIVVVPKIEAPPPEFHDQFFRSYFKR